ncbi:MAG TPA: hypothetical protein VE865_03545 [Bradyrhizobium sp.]|nr:hypothetical protein [Bradyrhizobium sp.]
MRTFETTDVSVARRCRYAQYASRKSTLMLCGSTITGIVHSVMEDASCAPKKWIIKISVN